jgi:glucarate dehydratase
MPFRQSALANRKIIRTKNKIDPMENVMSYEIAKIETHVVNVPHTREVAWSGGSTSGTTKTIVEVETRDGLAGLGEAPGSDAADRIRARIGGRLIGTNSWEHNIIREKCLGKFTDFAGMSDPGSVYAFAAIEMALWDIAGKRAGLPVYKLLGGAVRERAPFSAYAYSTEERSAASETDTPGIIADIARQLVGATGSAIFEFKIGRHSVDCDIATVHAVREALGQRTRIGVDANLAYTVDEARRFIEGTRSANLANLEEPVASLAGMNRLRQDFGIPISTHCSNFDQLANYPLIDSVVGDLHGDGGLAGNMVTAEVAARQGRRYWLRSHSELGIAFAAFAHVGIACQTMDHPAQCLINWVEHPLTTERWEVRDGGVCPPDKPGLGVELDRDALKHYAENHLREGSYSYYDRP